MTDAIVTEGLSKRFGHIGALQGIGFSVPQGELFGVIGADGAGKSTLFRILATLIVPDEGQARVLGRDTIADYRAIRTRIGYMPGRFSLYQDLSVEENLEFFATVYGTTVASNYDLIRDIYEQIEQFRERRAGQLSGGMKQKLALSCALVHRPELLLLDEPTTGVDAVSRQEFWQMLGRLRDEGLTIVVSTPYMDEASRCDRIAFLHEGRLLALDTPVAVTGLLSRPLYAVRAKEKALLVPLLRSFPHAAAAYAFGSSVHYTDRRTAPEIDELAGWLRNRGLSEVEIKQIPAGIEDTFMALLDAQPKGGGNG